MNLLLSTAVAAACWIVVGLRIWNTTHVPTSVLDKPARVYLDCALAYIAVATTTHAFTDLADRLLGPNVADLGWHVVGTAAGGCIVLYLAAESAGRRRYYHWSEAARALIPTIIAIPAIIGFWSLAPLHSGSSTRDMYASGAETPWLIRLYVSVFDVHLLTWTIPLAKRNWSLATAALRGRSTTTPARKRATANGQLGMAAAASLGSVAVVLTLVRALGFAILSSDTETALHAVNVVLSFAAPFVAVVAIAFPAIAYLRFKYRAVTALQLLTHALQHQTLNADAAAVPPPPHGIRLPAFAYRIATLSARVSDTLRDVYLTLTAANTVAASEDPPAAFGMILADHVNWKVDTSPHDPERADQKAVELFDIPADSDEALERLLRIAAGYQIAQALRVTTSRGA